jgi:hypothetical protein
MVTKKYRAVGVDGLATSLNAERPRARPQKEGVAGNRG